MYRLQKLEVRQFRGIDKPVTFTFGRRYHLIVGDNGAGKSNLLKLIAMVTQLDFSPMRDESFDIAWEGEIDDGIKIRGSIWREIQPLTEEMLQMRQFKKTAKWIYTFLIGNESKIEGSEEGEVGSVLDPVVRNWVPIMHIRSLIHVLHSKSFRMDEALQTFGVLVDGHDYNFEDHEVAGFSPVIYEYNSTKHTIMNNNEFNNLSKWATAFLEGNILPITEQDLPWLAQVRQDLDAQAVELKPKLKQSQPIKGGGQEIQFSGADIYITFAPQLKVHHSLLSFGQKRMISLRYYLSMVQSAPAIIDELSNGLHHAWTTSILEGLENQQSFLATQNPLVMDGVWWESATEAGQGILLCTRSPEHQWHWRQLDEEESLRFYEAWRSGVQHIHEVLKTERWW